jgi:hypothetical protein
VRWANVVQKLVNPCLTRDNPARRKAQLIQKYLILHVSDKPLYVCFTSFSILFHSTKSADTTRSARRLKQIGKRRKKQADVPEFASAKI